MKSADHDCCYLQVLVEMYILNVFVFLLQTETWFFLIIIIFYYEFYCCQWHQHMLMCGLLYLLVCVRLSGPFCVVFFGHFFVVIIFAIIAT